MSEPRIPQGAIHAAIDNVDELEFIDRGTFGDGWRIRRNGGSDEFLKVIVQGDARRVDREIAAMRAVNSSHVMRFADSGELTYNGSAYPWIIGEYVAGRSIAKHLESDEWPSELEALAAMIKTLRGLHAIHEQDQVHRDIKPQNIALRNENWSDPVILDLGLARDMIGTSITVYPSLMGTILYMAPEQLRRERAVRRSDVFAIGVMLYALLTRRHPFIDAAEPPVAIEVLEERIRDDDRPSWDGIQDDVRGVLKRMLRPDPFERPRAGMAADALQSILDSRRAA